MAYSSTSRIVSGRRSATHVMNRYWTFLLVCLFASTLHAQSGTAFVTSETLGTLRNDFSGWVGMLIQVGSSSTTVNSLGRMMVSGNTGTHLVKIVDTSGTDVSGASVSVAMSGGTPGSFVYGNLASPVTLNAGATYYVLSQETSSGDQWYDVNSTIQTTGIASELSAVYFYNGSYITLGSAGHTYVPLDFTYGTASGQVAAPTFSPGAGTYNAAQTVTISSTTSGASLRYTTDGTAPSATQGTAISNNGTVTVSSSLTVKVIAYKSGMTDSSISMATYAITGSTGGGTAFVTSKTLGTLRNDFSGWAGMVIQVGSSAMPVNSLGRMMASGNTGTHLVKIVDASGADVVGGSVWIAMSGGTAGSFVYGNLANPVTLAAGATYYFLSQEASGGDQWYDVNTTIQGGGAASEQSAVYFWNGAYVIQGSAGNTYVPIDFRYGAESQVSAPTFSPGGGSYSSTQTVTISSTTTGATIRYTTDGSTPSETAGTLYTAPVSVSSSVTIKAIAYESGFTDSGVASAAYTINTSVSTPTFTPGAGTYAVTEVVTITSTTPAASIRYTTDGSTPSETHGTPISNTGMVTVSSGLTLKAIAYKTGLIDSNVATGVYTIVAPSHITSVTPTSGAADVQINLSGTGFGSVRNNGAVWLGSTFGSVVSWSDTLIVAKVATNSVSGVAQVNQYGAWSNAVSFAVTPTTTISSVTPNSGLPGTQVTILGSGFGSSQNSGQVWLGTASGIVQNWSDTQVVAKVADGSATGIAQILQNGIFTNGGAFTVPLPHITSISPTSGIPGTLVTINGSNFGIAQGTGGSLLLGNTAASSISSWSDTQVQGYVASAALSGIVRIQQNSYSSNTPSFTITGLGGGVQSLAPNILNMMVGDTHSIEALSSTSQSVTGLTWTTTDSTIVSLSTSDPPVLTALAIGHVTITAGTATADITVWPTGTSLPTGTVLWSNPGNGSGVSKIVPAVPSVTGVADVFAFQNDGTVQAITSDGVTAWTADVSNATRIIPDFQGGLVQVHVSGSSGSIGRFDGITGQFQTLYNGRTTEVLATGTDGTIFSVVTNIDNSLTVIGIDPGTGALKFSVPVPHTTLIQNSEIPAGHSDGVSYAIAGDGYFYLTTGWTTPFQGGVPPATIHLRLMRVNSSGASDSSEVYTSQTSTPGDTFEVTPNMISNGDTGVLLSFVDFNTSPDTHIEATTGTNVVQVGTIAGRFIQNPAITPMVQAQDGSFIGSYSLGGQYYMVAFDASGNERWTVTNEQPQIATADGGVIGQSGIIYDPNGNATGQGYTFTPSWPGYAYQIGSVDQIIANPVFYALSFWAFQGGTSSHAKTAYFRRDSKANDKVRNLLSASFWNKFAGSHCGTIMADQRGMNTLLGASVYSLQQVRAKQDRTNFYDLGNPGVSNLTLNEVTGGQDPRTERIVDYVAGADAATWELGADNQTAVMMKSSILAQQRPEFDLVHEILFHAYGGKIDDSVFGNSFFVANGLWRPAGSTITTFASSWLSTDCTCTPGNPNAPPSCQANTATW